MPAPLVKFTACACNCDQPFKLRKDPAEAFTVGIDLTSKLPSGVTASSATVAVVALKDDSNASGIVGSATIGNNTEDPARAVVVLLPFAAAGTIGQKYKVTVSVTTSDSQILKYVIILSVRTAGE